MARSRWGRLGLCAPAAAAPLFAAAVAHAAPDAAAPPPSTVPAASDGAGEVVVTATRKAVPLSKVPESVSAFTAKELDLLEVKSFADLARFTPGVTFDRERHDVAIRGVSSKAGSGTTGIYIDDTPIQVRALGLNANNTLPNVFDLDRIEVLRGPQGTLFGAGAEGGAVRYITPQPSLHSFSALAHGEAGFSQVGAPSFETGVAVGGPIVEGVLGLRLSAWTRRDGGWIDRVDFQSRAVTKSAANAVDTTVLRGAATWRPAGPVTITPSIFYQNRVQKDADRYWVSISAPGRGRFLSGTPDQMADKDHFLLPSVKIEVEAPFARIISNTSFYDRAEVVNGYSGTLYNLSYFQQITSAGVDPQGAPCARCALDPSPLLTARGPNLPGFGPYVSSTVIANRQRNFTQEIRAQSPGRNERFSWIAGLFYSDDTQRSREEIRDPQLPALTQYLWGEDIVTAWGEGLLAKGDDYLNDTTGHDRQAAAFVDATYAVLPPLKVDLGLRYGWTHFDYKNLNDGPQDLLNNGGLPARAAGGRDETPFTPKVTVTYEVARDDILYATVSKGYRIGGATPPLPAAACGGVFPSAYDSDTTTNYEIGTKDRFMDRAVTVSASAFYITWKNIQQAVYVPQCGIQYTANLGDAVSKGFDVQGEWRVTQDLTVTATIGYTNAQFSSDAVQTLTSGPLVLARKGDALDVAPWTATFGAQYRFRIPGGEGFVRTDYEFAAKRDRPLPVEDPRISSSFFDPGLTPDPSTHQLSARIGSSIGRWDLALFVENLLDARPRLDLTHQDQFTLLYEATSLRPRTVGLAATYRY